MFMECSLNQITLQGCPSWPKGTGLGPVGAGLPGFESLPLHYQKFAGKKSKGSKVKINYLTCRGGVGGYPTGLWIPRLGFESRPRPLLFTHLFLDLCLSFRFVFTELFSSSKLIQVQQYFSGLILF